MIRDYFSNKTRSLHAVATTTTSLGSVIDWVSPPDGPPSVPPIDIGEPTCVKHGNCARTELEDEPSARGPVGTVPVFRFNVEGYLAVTQVPPADPAAVIHRKRPPPRRDPLPPAVSAGRYWYASWGENSAQDAAFGGAFFGTAGESNVWEPHLLAGDHSLFEVAVFGLTANYGDTVEAGWSVEPSLNGDLHPHLFVYYTTSNYASEGDWTGGYNGLQAGWHQVSTLIGPGTRITNPSVYLGVQTDEHIEIRQDSAGNWWVKFGAVWAGYYPVCRPGYPVCPPVGYLFHPGGIAITAPTVSQFGEVASNAPSWWNPAWGPWQTSTQMGSGHHPSEGGFQISAYDRNLIKYVTLTGWQLYNPSGNHFASEPACYGFDGPFASTDATWRNWFNYGGYGCAD